MEIAHPPPVNAVVLARPSRGANKGIVLINRRGYETYIGPRSEERDIAQAEHLADAARARAKELYDGWTFVGPAEVYDYNPTNKPLGRLTLSKDFDLRLRDGHAELDNNTPLHGLRDPDDGTKVVDTFFVLVTAFDPAVPPTVRRIHGSPVASPAPPVDTRTTPPRGIGRRAAQLIRPARPTGFFAQWRLRLVQVSLDFLDPQLATLSQHGGIRECIKAFAIQLRLGGSVQRLRGRNIRVTVEGTAANVQRFLDELDAVWCRELAMISPLSTLEDVTITRRSHIDFQILTDLCCASFVETGRYSPDDYKTYTSRSANQEVHVDSDV